MLFFVFENLPSQPFTLSGVGVVTPIFLVASVFQDTLTLGPVSLCGWNQLGSRK